MSSSKKLSLWLRIFNIAFGIISIILAFLVITDFGLALVTLLFILASVMILVGITRIVNGIFDKNQSLFPRILKIGLGVLMLPLSIVVIAYPGLGENIMIILLAGALIANGATRIIVGGYEEKLPSWFRVLLILIGVITVFLGSVTIIYTGFGLFTLIVLLALTFIINGVARIMFGLVGYDSEYMKK